MSINKFYRDCESLDKDKIINKFNNTDNAYKKFLLRFLCDNGHISSQNCSNSDEKRLKIKLKDLELAYINMTFANSNLNNWTKITKGACQFCKNI